MLQKVFISITALLIITAVLVLRPVPIVTEEKALVEKGIVSDIYGTENKDIVFHLKNNKRVYYINRGLEQGLDINDLKKKLIGNEVFFKYPNFWTPLDWNNKIKHVSKVEINSEVIYNELKK